MLNWDAEMTWGSSCCNLSFMCKNRRYKTLMNRLFARTKQRS